MAEQQVPGKLYSSERRMTVAATMPGVEPGDIHVSLSGQGDLTLRAVERAQFKGEHQVLLDEWSPGAYFRLLHMDRSVDAALADASYENGILVVSLPFSERIGPGEIRLARSGHARGRRSLRDGLGF